MANHKEILLNIVFFISILLPVAVNVEATISSDSRCFDKSTNYTFRCINGKCEVSESVTECVCYSGYFGRNCDMHHKSFLSETIVGIIILIPAVIWIILRIYNRKHKISRNSRIRKRPRPSTIRRRSEESDEDDNSSIDENPPNYSIAVGPDDPSQHSLFMISSTQPSPFILPSYEDVLKEKEEQGGNNIEMNRNYRGDSGV